MKVGICIIDMPETLGGGFVLRNDVARIALASKGDHEFVALRAVLAPLPFSSPRSLSLDNVNAFFRSLQTSFKATASAGPKPFNPANRIFIDDVQNMKLDVLWFNHIEPIDVGLPYILNIFDLQHRLQPCFPEVSANGQWEQREAAWADSLRRAWIITVGSDEAKEQLSLFYGIPLDRIRVLPFPTPQRAIDTATQNRQSARSESEIRKKYGISGEFLFYPAQLWPHKNHVNLIRALPILRERHNIKLSLVLTGSDQGNRTHIEKLVSDLNLSSCVHLLGFVSPEELMVLYTSAFALSYVSFFGPENLPPLEALALGCPIVLADVPGVRALFGDGPILVDPRSDESIAAGVKRLYDDPALRRKFIKSGQAIAVKNSAENYVEQLRSLLDELAPIRRCWP